MHTLFQFSHHLLHLALLPFPAVAVLCHSDLPDLTNAVELLESVYIMHKSAYIIINIYTWKIMYMYVH